MEIRLLRHICNGKNCPLPADLGHRPLPALHGLTITLSVDQTLAVDQKFSNNK